MVTEQMRKDARFVKPMLLVKHRSLAFARAAQLLSAARHSRRCIHPTAVDCWIGRDGRRVSVGRVCGDRDEAKIGDGTMHWRGGGRRSRHVVLARMPDVSAVVIYSGVTLGDRVIVHAGAVLGSDGFGYVRDEATGEYVQFPQQGTMTSKMTWRSARRRPSTRGPRESGRVAG